MGSRDLGFHVLSGRRWRSWSQLGSRYSRECDLPTMGRWRRLKGLMSTLMSPSSFYLKPLPSHSCSACFLPVRQATTLPQVSLAKEPSMLLHCTRSSVEGGPVGEWVAPAW